MLPGCAELRLPFTPERGILRGMELEAQWDAIRNLLSGQRLAVLATAHANVPYTSIVAFAETADLRQLFFVTMRDTRKFRNLAVNPEAALLVDNRRNIADDFHQAVAVTAVGSVKDLKQTPTDVDADAQRALFLSRHPYLMDFLDAPSTAFCALRVKKFVWVDHFQHVVEIDLTL